MKKRRRPERNREIIFGVNPIAEALKADKRKFLRITIKKGVNPSGAIRRIIDTARRRKIVIEYADMDHVAKLAGAEGHQGIAALVSCLSMISLDKLIDYSKNRPNPSLALLDGIQDPGNFGAIIRYAEAFGFDGVIFPAKRAAGYTPVAAKSSAGAGELLRLCRVTNIAETVRRLKDEGYECIALDSEAAAEFTTPAPGSVAVVLGGEGEGVRPLVKKRCKAAGRIPMKGKVGSLNVSAAAAIVFHIVSAR